MKYLILLILLGCGSGSPLPVYIDDPTFTEDKNALIAVIREIEGDTEETRAIINNIRNIPIVVGDLPSLVGQCHYTHITIDVEWIGTYGQKWAVWHELGHCVLNLPHVDTPGDVMAPNLPHKEGFEGVNYDFIYRYFNGGE